MCDLVVGSAFLATTPGASFILEMRFIAHLSVFFDIFTNDLMGSTYFFISTNAAAAVASCAGFLTGFLTGAVMCFSHGGGLLVWMFEVGMPGMSMF